MKNKKGEKKGRKKGVESMSEKNNNNKETKMKDDIRCLDGLKTTRQFMQNERDPARLRT